MITTFHTNAADLFLCDYDDEGRNIALTNAIAYCLKRQDDYFAINKEMVWHITADGVMQCRIYGHSILLTFKDGKLHHGFKAGNCEVHNTSWPDVKVVDDIKQVIAYLLARFW